MSKKSKAKGKDASPSTRVIDFNALLGNWPTITLGDIEIEGRHVNQTERLAWAEAERADDPVTQRAWLTNVLNARGADVTDEWVSEQPDLFLVALVRGLHGLGWPGEEEGAEGK